MLCDLDGRVVRAYLPNPGRLAELLLPDSVMYLVESEPSPGRKTDLTAVAVEREGHPIMLHTHKTNDVARSLIEGGKVPGLEQARIIKAEATRGSSRFDFLLDDQGRRFFLEVKSCTLVGSEVAMFPDAVTARGAKHLKELQEISREGLGAAVLFVVHWPVARFFMPDYHTDLAFAERLLEVREDVRIIPLAVEWDRDLALIGEPRLLEIPWGYIEEEARDRGSYLLVLHLGEDREIPVGSLGSVPFRKGFYIYVGSAMATLTKRIERHLRMRKRHHWHIDELRAVCDVRAALAIRASARLECDIAAAVSPIADWSVPGFGSSDCRCPTHLFAMDRDPIATKPFQDLLRFFRMDRFTEQGVRE